MRVLAAPGCRPRCSSAMRALARLRLRQRRCASRMVSIELVADAIERIEAGQRVLEHHADALAADAAHLPRAADCRCACRRSSTSPPAMRPGGSIRPMMAVPVIDLPAPDSPTTPSTSPRRDVEGDVVDRGQRAAPGRKLDPQIADAEHGRPVIAASG